MKRILVLLCCVAVVVLMGTIMHSCNTKDSVNRLSYSVDTIYQNLYIGDSGITHWQVKLSFLSGNPNEQVTMTLNGLPARISVTPATVTAVPTINQDFQFYTNHQTHGTYPVNLTVYSPTTGNKIFYFNIIVVNAGCALNMPGTYSGSNACIVGSGPYTATVTNLGSDTININNLGGYGTSSNTRVAVNCNVDSLIIPYQTDGNGDTIMGAGTFNNTGMILYYTKKTAAGNNDQCTATLTK